VAVVCTVLAHQRRELRRCRLCADAVRLLVCSMSATTAADLLDTLCHMLKIEVYIAPLYCQRSSAIERFNSPSTACYCTATVHMLVVRKL
jgi:hypothetical protein